MYKRIYRILTWLLALGLLMASVPVSAQPEDGAETPGAPKETAATEGGTTAGDTTPPLITFDILQTEIEAAEETGPAEAVQDEPPAEDPAQAEDPDQTEGPDSAETEEPGSPLPVIYARALENGGAISEFTGFTITDDVTETFVDRTFLDADVGAAAGVYSVRYDLSQLQAFRLHAQAVVTVCARDAAGNAVEAEALCIVRDMDAPYYEGDDHIYGGYDGAILYHSIDGGEPYRFKKEAFINGNLRELSGLKSIYIESLPENGTLQYLDDEGEWSVIEAAPFEIRADAIEEERLRYMAGAPADIDLFRLSLEDDNGNRTAEDHAVYVMLGISPAVGGQPPTIEGLPAEAIVTEPGGEAFTFDLTLSDSVTPSSLLEASIITTGEAANATLTLSYISGNTWRVRGVTRAGVTGSADYRLFVENGLNKWAQGTFTATTRYASPFAVTAVNDAVNGAARRSFLIDVLGNDIPYADEALRVESISAPQYGTAEIVGNKIRYTYDAGKENSEDTFTYTVAHDGRSRRGETLAAVVSINDKQAPAISSIHVDSAGGEGWRAAAELQVEATDAGGIARITVRSREDAADTGAMVLRHDSGDTYTIALDGSGTFVIAAYDYAGNKAEKEITIANVDGVPPAISANYRTGITGGYAHNALLSVGIKDSGSGVAAVTVHDGRGNAIEGATVKDEGSNIYIISLSKAVLDATAVYIAAEDAAGNAASYYAGTFTRDDDAPVIEWLEEAEKDRYYLPRLLRITDSGSGIQSYEGVEHVEGDIYRTDFLHAMDYQDTIVVYDTAGNETRLGYGVALIPEPWRHGADDMAAATSLRIASEEMRAELDGLQEHALSDWEEQYIEDIIAASKWTADAITAMQEYRVIANRLPVAQALLARRAAMTERQKAILSTSAQEGIEGTVVTARRLELESRLLAFEEKDGADYSDEEIKEIEDLVIEYSLLDDRNAGYMERLMRIYEDMVAAKEASIRGGEVAVLVLGALSRMDVEENARISVQAEAAGVDQPEAEQSGYVGVAAVSVEAKAYVGGREIAGPSVREGERVLIYLPLNIPEGYDMASLEILRYDGMRYTQTEVVKSGEGENGAYAFVMAGGMGTFSAYVKPAEEAAAEEPPLTETPAPTPVPETPAQETPAQKTPAQKTPVPETPAPTAGAAGDTPAPGVPVWPVYIIAGIVALLLVLRGIVGLRNTGKDGK